MDTDGVTVRGEKWSTAGSRGGGLVHASVTHWRGGWEVKCARHQRTQNCKRRTGRSRVETQLKIGRLMDTHPCTM